MREFAKLSLTLAAICLIAGAALGGTNLLTADRIAAQNEALTGASRRAIFTTPDAKFEQAVPSDFAGFENVNDVYTVSENGEVIGFAIEVAEEGYHGKINLTVGINTDMSVAGIRINENIETAGLGARITEPDFYEQFSGVADSPVAISKDGGTIEAVSGASISSRAVVKGVNLAHDVAAHMKESTGG